MSNTAAKLNDLLRGEIAACETYRQALDVAKDTNISQALMASQACHASRAAKLSALVVAEGDTPVTESGAWGAFAKLVAGGAAALGEEAALGSLEEGEDQGLKTYRDEAKSSDPKVSAIVVSELLPGQEKTYKVITDLKNNFAKLTA